ncbi:MAG: ABC transporter ATP-binding protein [Planctomycetota bacterium]|jgi:ATP-binding cassette subfamily B protein
MIEKKYSDFTIIWMLLSQARPYWFHIIGIFLLGLLAAPLALLMPVSLKIAVDSVIGSDPLPGFLHLFIPGSIMGSKYSLLILAVCMQVLVVLFIQSQSTGIYLLQTYTGERLTLGFRDRLFSHVQRLSFMFHDSRGTADSIYRIQYDTPSIQHITIYGMIPLISASITFFSMIYVTARINLQLALVALSVSPFLFFITHSYKVRMRSRYQTVKQMESHSLNIVQEVLTAFRIVKAFGREEREQERFISHSDNTLRARIRLSFAEGVFGLSVNMITAVGAATVLFIGIRNVQAGILTLGELLMIIAYMSMLYGPLKTISQKAALLQSSFASAQRVFDLIDEIPDVVEQPNAQSLKRAAGNIELRNVSFTYDGKNNVLRNVSFHVEPGTRVGIAGRTGAGKTTLMSLLTRFYDPSSGQILLDGVDIRNYKLDDLRNQFSIVLQESVLFSTTIEENISYGSLEAGREAIVEAAKAANVHDVITNLSDGYDTLVGERGMRLSGGERQRIALARAFLRDAPILILDEPTSSVDTATEAVIMEAMERLMEGRTVFMIAHRLSTLENCNVQLMIEDGSLIKETSEVTATIKNGLVAE